MGFWLSWDMDPWLTLVYAVDGVENTQQAQHLYVYVYRDASRHALQDYATNCKNIIMSRATVDLTLTFSGHAHDMLKTWILLTLNMPVENRSENQMGDHESVKAWKKSIVTPLLNKLSLDAQDMKN